MSWRKRVGVEPTTRLAKSRIAGFEGREDHRIPFASAVCENNQRTKFAEGAQLGVPPTKHLRPSRVFDRMRSTSTCRYKVLSVYAKAAHREIGAPGSSHAGRRERRALIGSKQCGYEIKQRWRSANFVVGMLGRHAEFSILQ